MKALKYYSKRAMFGIVWFKLSGSKTCAVQFFPCKIYSMIHSCYNERYGRIALVYFSFTYHP